VERGKITFKTGGYFLSTDGACLFPAFWLGIRLLLGIDLHHTFCLTECELPLAHGWARLVTLQAALKVPSATKGKKFWKDLSTKKTKLYKREKRLTDPFDRELCGEGRGLTAETRHPPLAGTNRDEGPRTEDNETYESVKPSPDIQRVARSIRGRGVHPNRKKTGGKRKRGADKKTTRKP